MNDKLVKKENLLLEFYRDFVSLDNDSNCETSLPKWIEFEKIFHLLFDFYIEHQQWAKIFNLIEIINKIPRNVRLVDVLLRIADFFFEFKYELEALQYYRMAVNCSLRTNLRAVESFENLLNNLIERWHYRMLNDSVRNRAYSKVISKRIQLLSEHKKYKTIT
jgi:hypothetical protein